MRLFKQTLFIVIFVFMTGCIGPSVKKEYNQFIYVFGDDNTIRHYIGAIVPQEYTTEGEIKTDPDVDLNLPTWVP